jgi:two-component system, NarL family, response regulator LiaR
MKVLVVDDDPLVSRSLKVLLSREPDLEVVATAGDGASAIAVCERSLPEAVLMDIRMPGMDGIEATRRIKERWPGVRVLILTTFQDDESIHRALQAGADGYLLKSTPTSGMAQRLRALGTGASVVDAEVLKRLGGTSPAPLEGLTPRENDVAELVAQGCSNREIAGQLFLSEGTVRNTLSVVLDKLGLRDRTQLAIRYWKRPFLDAAH